MGNKQISVDYSNKIDLQSMCILKQTYVDLNVKLVGKQIYRERRKSKQSLKEQESKARRKMKKENMQNFFKGKTELQN